MGLTDNEIVKALKDIIKYIDFTQTKSGGNVLANALDLINRLQEDKQNLDIELQAMRNAANGFKAERNKLADELYEAHKEEYIKCMPCIEQIKTEAVKEFAERSEKEIFIKQDNERMQMLEILKTYRGTKAYSDTEQATDNWLRGYGEAVQDVLGVFNNLLKEWVGDGSGKM